MSRSLNDVNEVRSSELDRANATFGEMIRRGRSYSGRERNCCFLNTTTASTVAGAAPVARFANISATSGIDLPDDGRALITVDWDHDGDLDVWISNRNAPRLRFFRNDVPSENHHLALRLQGAGGTTNRDAIGARVEVVLAGGSSRNSTRPALTKTLRAGDSFLSQSTKWMHFGLGRAEKIELVRVRWPGGEIETFTGLEIDRRHRLVQGSGVAVPAATKRRETAISPVPVTLPDPDSTARIPLATLLPMADLSYQTFSGGVRKFPTGKGKSILLNLWASWCTPCVGELEELSERNDELRDAGIEVLALAVDQLDDSVDASVARKLAKRLKLPFTTGQAPRKLVAYLQKIHNDLITSSQPLPVPVSFLIDGNSRISVIYKGRLDVDDLAADTQHSKGTLRERFARSAAVPGRILPVPTVARRRNQFEARYRFATYLQQRGYAQSAAAENQELIKMFPENAGPYNNLGISYISQKKHALAEASFREALRVQPDHARSHTNLATLLIEKGKTGEAAGHLEQAIKSNPREEKNHKILSGLLIAQKRWADAQACLEKAVAENPHSANFNALLGMTLAQQGQLARAVTYLEYALEVQPDHKDARRNLTVVRGMIAQGNGAPPK
ncbi:MAG: tetratricopeptide repeat protein [Verrucomicrobiota bacterium]|nr:tetratricopeptide repeat protein [Verrucomicrobiota bacterium]